MNKTLQEIHNNYLKIEPPEGLKDYGWQALKEQIEEQEKRKFFFLPVLSRSLIFISLAVFILTVTAGFAYASWKAAPGDVFYPVKQLSERIISNFSTNKTNKVDTKDKQDILNTPSPQPEQSQKDTDHKEQEMKKTNQIEKTKNDKSEELIKTIKFPDGALKKDDSGNQSSGIMPTISNLKKDIENEVKGLENNKVDIKTDNKLDLP